MTEHSSGRYLRAICILGFLALIGAGCSTPHGKFEARRDSSYREKVGRVLLVPRNEDMGAHLGKHFLARFVARLQPLLAAKESPSDLVRLPEGELNPETVITRAAAKFRADQILEFAVIRVVSDGSTHTSIVIRFIVTDTRSGKVVWRADASYYFHPEPEVVANELCEELQAAGLL